MLLCRSYKIVLKLKVEPLIAFVEIPFVSLWEIYPFNKNFFTKTTNTIKYWKTIRVLSDVLPFSLSLSLSLLEVYALKEWQKRNKRSKKCWILPLLKLWRLFWLQWNTYELSFRLFSLIFTHFQLFFLSNKRFEIKLN